MLTPPSFFLDHQLNSDADERAVKRAYARSLKKIDQETDLEGFQALREAYDAALSWLRYRDQFQGQFELQASEQAEADEVVDVAAEHIAPEATPAHQDASVADDSLPQDEPDIAQGFSGFELQASEQAEADEVVEVAAEDIAPEATPAHQDASVADDSLPQEEPDIAQSFSGHDEIPALIDEAPAINPGQLAEQIFNEMLDAMRQHVHDNDFAGQNLIAILDDPRLFHMETRLLFETALAEYLLQGWQPGNGELFDVAAQSFGWMTDRPRLLQLGRAGWLIDRALTSASEFYRKDKKVRAKYWAVVVKIRTEKNPLRFYLKANLGLFQYLQDTCYSWLCLVTNRENLEQWSAVAEGISTPEDTSEQPKFIPQEETNAKPAYWIFFVIFLVFGMFNNRDKTTPKYDPGQFTSASRKLDALDGPDSNLTVEQRIRKAGFLLALSKNDGNDLKLAVRALESAAGDDSSEAAYRLGWLYRDGKFAPADKQRQYAWFLRAAELGHTKASIIVGDLLMDGLDGKPNHAEAFQHYKKAADSGDGQGQFKLAYMIDRGYGIKPDRAVAARLIKSSADKGFAYSESLMGQFHLRGEYGFPRDEVKSANWFSLSAQHGDASGERYFGLVHEQGLGSYKINLEEAVKWYRKAVDSGDREAEKSLQRLCKKREFSECKPGPASINTISVVSKVN